MGSTSGAFPPPGPLGGCPSSCSKARSFKRPMLLSLLSSDTTLALTKLSCPCPEPQSFTLWVTADTRPAVANYSQSISLLLVRKTRSNQPLSSIGASMILMFRKVSRHVYRHLAGKGLYTISKIGASSLYYRLTPLSNI